VLFISGFQAVIAIIRLVPLIVVFSLRAFAAELPPELAALKWVEQDADELTIAYPEKWKLHEPFGDTMKLYAVSPDPGTEELFVTVIRPPGLGDTAKSKAAFMASAIVACKKPQIGVTVHSCDFAKFGKTSGVLTISDVDHTRRNVTVRLRTMSFAVLNGTKLYTVTCRCAPDDFDANIAMFGVVFQNLVFKAQATDAGRAEGPTR